jgi:hypothetical protein
MSPCYGKSCQNYAYCLDRHILPAFGGYRSIEIILGNGSPRRPKLLRGRHVVPLSLHSDRPDNRAQPAAVRHLDQCRALVRVRLAVRTGVGCPGQAFLAERVVRMLAA